MKTTKSGGILVLAAVVLTSAGGCKSEEAGGGLTLDLGNKVTMRLALIPAGRFMMGSPKDEKGRDDIEGPQHEVAITKPFYMGIHEVTQQQYKQIMGKDPSDHRGRRNPVERVSWHDAVEFCQKLSQKSGKTARLPTEAEWEYACRAGSTTPYNTGETITTRQANCGSGRGGLGRKPKAVGSFKPNDWGLHDMHGNVWEWCSDRFRPNYYANAEKADPQGPASGGYRVVRGGDYDNRPLTRCRSAFRHWQYPGFRLISSGFRVVVDLE